MSTRNTARTARSFSTSYPVEASPHDVFSAICDVDAWWTGQVDGRADHLGAEFTYRHPPQHVSRQRVIEFVPGRRVVWQVMDSNLTFASDPTEWTGSKIVFDIVAAPDSTELRFTHVGLVPDVECFDACSIGWLHYVDGSLRRLIDTGTGLPDPW